VHAAVAAIANLLSVIVTGRFAGGALMQSIVDHPARQSAEPRCAIVQMQAVLGRADPYMPILALIGTAGSIASCFLENPAWVTAMAALVLFPVIPFTIVFIVPINRQMMAIAGADHEHQDIRRLMKRWAHLHAARSVLGCLALVHRVCPLIPIGCGEAFLALIGLVNRKDWEKNNHNDSDESRPSIRAWRAVCAQIYRCRYADYRR
jgi:Domain of unknown function (DUF1772)